jgi:hypothetical protein
MNTVRNLCLRPILRLLPGSRRSKRHRVPRCAAPAAQTTQTMSTPLDCSSIVLFCVVCIEAGRPTEATYQTQDHLFGCDQHIQELEQHGRAALRRQRAAVGRQLIAEARGDTGRRAPGVRIMTSDREQMPAAWFKSRAKRDVLSG